MSKFVVLHICLSKGWGGLEMYPIRTGKWLQEQNCSVLGLAIEGTPTHTGMCDAGFETFNTKSKGRLISRQLPALIKWIKKKRVNIIHCHKSGDLLIAALLKSFVPTVRVIFTEHMGVKRPKKDIYHRWVYHHIDQVLSISNETYKRNIEALPVPKEKVERLWLGTPIPDLIQSKQYLSDIKTTYNVPLDKRVIGIVGRISPGKGHLELIKAFQVVHDRIPNTRLLIVGGLNEEQGADLDYLDSVQKEIAQHSLQQHVIFTGFSNDVHALYSIMDVVCLPYANEAFGLTAIEAMSAGRPIAASNTGALPEIIDTSGLHFDPTVPSDIASKLISILQDTELATQLGSSARKRAEEEFSATTHITKLLKYYANSTKN
ncbi:glycosyltransferase family 4 protein [Vibrio sp.]|nr:glycosyltransferase family 4 protein [Vibrio sp.]